MNVIGFRARNDQRGGKTRRRGQAVGCMETLWGLRATRGGDLGKSAVDIRWVLTWKTVEGVKTAKARLVAKGFQDPGLRAGAVDTSGCASFCSPLLQVIPWSGVKKMDAVEPGYKERHAPMGWLQSRCSLACSRRMGQLECMPFLEMQLSGVWIE